MNSRLKIRIASLFGFLSVSALSCSTPINAPAPQLSPKPSTTPVPVPLAQVTGANNCRIHNVKDYIDFKYCFDVRKDGSLQVKPEILKLLDFKNAPHKHIPYSDFTRIPPKNIANSKITMGYILPSGRAHDVIFFDNGPDYFENGLARFIGQDGKIGFINEKLEAAIRPTHDFVAPFRDGQAYFCDGCKLENTPGDGHPDDHHASVVGGQWGVMNTKGKTIRGPMAEKELFPHRQ